MAERTAGGLAWSMQTVPDRRRFYDLKRLTEDAPFIFCDHQSRDEGGGFEQNTWNGMLLKSASDEHILVAESMAHYYKGGRTFRLSGGEAPEVRKWMAVWGKRRNFTVVSFCRRTGLRQAQDGTYAGSFPMGQKE